MQTTQSSAPVLEARNISFTRHRAILQRVSIALYLGQPQILIGPNGGGKSTFLRILAGAERPDSGTITYRERTTIAYIPQKFIPHFSFPIRVERFLLLGNGGNGKAKLHKNSVQLKEQLEKFQLLSLLETPLHALSGGELQRVLLVRALLLQPGILIMDEPEQGLDYLAKHSFYQQLKVLARDPKLSFMIATHDQQLIDTIAAPKLCLDCMLHSPTHWHPA